MRIYLVLILLAIASAACAQSIGGMSGLGPLVSKASSGGGGVVAACAINLQLDFTNSCNLIGQMTGN